VPILVDTNVIVDVITDDPTWADWSLAQLEANEADGLTINPAIYAELSYGFAAPSGVDELLKQFGLAYQEIPRLGLFKAAKAYEQYRQRGGSRTNVLPDFFVGGHAEATGLHLLTRDVARFRTYFPSVALLCP
jgi:predicted nucleic acid-binding protein